MARNGNNSLKHQSPLINGFLSKPRLAAGGEVYTGRFTCHGVNWSGSGSDAVASFTVTAAELADAAAGNLLWTDQDVQRGVKPEVIPRPALELSLADGYPEPGSYIFDSENADDIVEKLLRGDKLFLGPLIWNLRPGEFKAFFDTAARSIYLYSDKIYLPDSHHRQQAIAKAVKTYREAPSDYPKFSETQEFTLQLYFLSREDEGNYFYDKNQRPRPTANSKAYDLSTTDDLSVLAKKVIERSNALKANVNRVTDRLTAKNPQVITLSTLREAMKGLAPSGALDAAELDGLAQIAASFYDLLASVRPELGHLSLTERRVVRDTLVSESAVMMHGYFSLIQLYRESIAKNGSRRARMDWAEKLAALSASHRYSLGNWRGDFFDKQGPLWLKTGITKPSNDASRRTVTNTGATRSECGRILRQFLSTVPQPTKLDYLVG